MPKKWNKGTNCVLLQDFGSFRSGDRAWVLETSDTDVTFFTKTRDVVAPERALQKIVVPISQAETIVKATTGKPRKDFSKFSV